MGAIVPRRLRPHRDALGLRRGAVVVLRHALMTALSTALLMSPGRALADSTADIDASETDGYARIILDFDQIPQIKTKFENNILVVSFSSPVKVPVDKLSAALGDYVAAARIDPDGRAVRMALAQRVKINTIEADNQFYIDLLPDGWKDPPPSLPQDVIAKLNTKAHEADQLRQEVAAREAMAQPTPIDVRAAREPTFSRISFVLEKPVPVSLQRQDRTVRIDFDAKLHADVAGIKAQLPPYLSDITTSEADARLDVLLSIAPNTDVRAFWDGPTYVVDLSGGRTSSADPPAISKLLAVPSIVGDNVTSLPSSSDQADAALPPQPDAAPSSEDAPLPAQLRTVPAALPKDITEAIPVAPAAAPSGVAVAPAATALQAAVPVPIPAVPSTGPVVPAVTTSGKTVRIRFPFSDATASAVYRRGDNLWLVFDTSRVVDVAAIKAQVGDIVSDATLIASDGAVVVRLRLKTSPLTTVSPDGFAWIVSIGDQILGAAAPVILQRAVASDGRTAMMARLDGLGRVHMIEDTDIGDKVAVVTVGPPARGFPKPQSFVEFRTLATAQGLAFVPIADDVTVTTNINDVLVHRNGGLTLSPTTVLSVESASQSSPTLLDADQWNHEIEAPFHARETDLIRAVTVATEADRTKAQIALARFYLAKDYAAEAGAVLDVAAAADTNAGHASEFGILRAASRALMGRGAEANRIITDQGLDNTPDGALWHAVADAANHDFGGARQAFQKGVTAVGLYPKPLQMRLREVAYEAALEAGDIGDAEAQKAAIAALKIDGPPSGHGALLDARLAEAEGRKSDALEFYRRAVASPDAVTAAEAQLRSIELRHAMGQTTDKAMVEQLEILQALWRGDEIEARTLRLLSEAYLKDGRYRDAFEDMKVALTHFPKSPSTRSMQDEMQRQFMALYLGDKTDRLSPIDALALFYDYRDLTPADARGDEMIRRLADRLVDVDLLDQAADLLQHQIDMRLTGAGRAQVAAKLAMIELMNHKPMLALKALDGTRQTDLPSALLNARLLIEARALADTAHPDLAIEILDQVDSPVSARLKSDILWQARRWPEAGATMENLLGDAWQGVTPLTDDQRGVALRVAIAYSLANDKIGLDRVRSKFSAKMANSPDASSFDTVTAPIEAHGSAFADVAKQIASTDTLEAFLKDYRKRYMSGPLPASPPQPGQPSALADTKSTAG